MSSRLQGRTALVTGAAQGIGLAIGRAFLAEGATLIASDVAADRLAAAYAGTSARLTVLDVTDEVAVNEAATCW
jgi:NAD(P)-dependent dehydrogenase (short-subunit alcohol dehydrogenase family)